MSRYLVVANQTIRSARLVTELRGLCEQDPAAEFVLLVPATPVRDLLFRRSSEEKAEAVGQRHAEKGRELFAREGMKLIDARVGPGDPIEAVDQELGERAGSAGYAGVVISTLPGESSRWVKAGLPQHVQSRYGLPVFQVEAPPAWAYVP